MQVADTHWQWQVFERAVIAALGDQDGVLALLSLRVAGLCNHSLLLCEWLGEIFCMGGSVEEGFHSQCILEMLSIFPYF